jgi:hypothetical protein
VAYFLEVGFLLVFVPWSPFWDRNYFADLIPAVGWAMKNTFVRGGVSGLGLVNIVAGLAELFSMFSPSRR